MVNESTAIPSELGPQRTPLAPWYTVGSGALAAGYGFLVAIMTWASWSSLTPPGTTIGPESFVQALALRIDQGIYLGILGCVLIAGGGFLLRRDLREYRHTRDPVRPWRWRGLLLAAAVLLVLAVFVLGALTPPERRLDFSPTDFQLAPATADAPFETYEVSRPFAASAGEYFISVFNVAWRDNATGGIIGWENVTSSYVKGESDPYGHPQFGSGWVAPSTGSYVVVVRSSLCETLATPPCSNGTLGVTGFVLIGSPTAYLPLEAGLGVASCGTVGAAVVQSGLGSRRTAS